MTPTPNPIPPAHVCPPVLHEKFRVVKGDQVGAVAAAKLLNCGSRCQALKLWLRLMSQTALTLQDECAVNSALQGISQNLFYKSLKILNHKFNNNPAQLGRGGSSPWLFFLKVEMCNSYLTDDQKPNYFNDEVASSRAWQITAKNRAKSSTSQSHKKPKNLALASLILTNFEADAALKTSKTWNFLVKTKIFGERRIFEENAN